MDKATFDLYLASASAADLIMRFLATSVPCEPATPYAGATAVSAELTGLTMETAYVYRIVAENANGTRSGEVLSFTPRAVIGISTDDATEITQTTAMVHGSFDPNGEDTTYYFEWGTDDTYGNVSAEAPGVDAGSTPGDTPVSFELEGLSSFTTYHYRLVATNCHRHEPGPG